MASFVSVGCKIKNVANIIKVSKFRKQIVKPKILPKNERMNSFLLVYDVFSFVFWENPRPEKKHFEII